MATFKAGLDADHFVVPKFVPEIWTGRLISNLQGSTIMPGLCTREYEGELCF